MEFSHLVSRSDELTTKAVIMVILGMISIYATARCFYNLYFHPLANFPGPRIAAISNVWYAHHWLTGRYPYAVEDALKQYGDVVRIAPNELVFFTPRAFTDIYSPQKQGLEVFPKTDFQNRGANLGGIVWEEDPVKHRLVAKKLAPAFSPRNIRSMEPVIHKHLDYFVARMRSLAAAPGGIDLVDWTHWVAWDTSADLAWNEEMFAMRDERNPVYLDVLQGFNVFSTIIQVFKRFPLIGPVKYLLAPISKLSSLAAMEKATRASVFRRIDRRGQVPHPDLFDFILPADRPPPTANPDVLHLGSVALQVMFAGFGTMADWYYGVLVLLLSDPACYELLTAEIRGAFARYDDIVAAATTPDALPYLQACLEETLRLLPVNLTGLPRRSPGAVVDGHYVPRGATVQTCIHALGRSPRFFREAGRFRPRRNLPRSHPLADDAFAGDAERIPVFGLGPRACSGRGLAWIEARLFLAKVLWRFDLVKAEGETMDVKELDRRMLHYGFYVKPEVRVRFLPVDRVKK